MMRKDEQELASLIKVLVILKGEEINLMKIQGPATSPKFSKDPMARNIIFKEKLPMAPSFILYLGEESIVSSRSSCRGKVLTTHHGMN